MPIVLALIVLIAAIYCFSLFAKRATQEQKNKVLVIGGLILAALSLMFLAVTERLPFALGILIGCWPATALWLEKRRQKKSK